MTHATRNTTQLKRPDRRRFARQAATLAGAALVFGPNRIGAQEISEPALVPSTQSGPNQAGSGRPEPRHDAISLDGLAFSGPTGTIGMDAHHNEIVRFSNGLMSSSVCEQWGFMPGPYKAHRTETGIRFTAVLFSKKYGRIGWVGEIKGKTVSAEYHWRKERLFWTLKNSYWFTGAHTG